MTASVPEACRRASAELRRHPAGADDGAVRRIAADVAWQPATRQLTLRYRLEGDPGGLLVPAPAAPRRTDGLWRHTCFEAFVQAAAGPGYLEFNFSPSGEWAAYHFDGRRLGMRELEVRPDPVIRCRLGPGMLELESTLTLAAVPGDATLRLGLAAVVETTDGSISWWALRHAPGRADFHDPSGFTLVPEPAAPGPATEDRP